LLWTCPFPLFTPRRPKPETLKRKALERKAQKHGSKGLRGAKRLEMSGGKGSGSMGRMAASGSKSGSKGGARGSTAAAGGRRGSSGRPGQRLAKFK
jgi:hypothetical protein